MTDEKIKEFLAELEGIAKVYDTDDENGTFDLSMELEMNTRNLKTVNKGLRIFNEENKITLNKEINNYEAIIVKETVKHTLEILNKDGVIDCNEYQGEDFDRLMTRIRDGV